MKAGYRVKQEGLNNNLIDLIIEDPAFKMSKEEILSIMDPKNFVGRAPEQVVEFVNETLEPAIKEYKELTVNVRWYEERADYSECISVGDLHWQIELGL